MALDPPRLQHGGQRVSHGHKRLWWAGVGVEEEDGCGLTRASGMAAVGEAAARSRSSERATKGSHHNEADTVLVPAPAPPPPPEVEAVGPPLAMAGEQ
jgi:hypothetical protein